MARTLRAAVIGAGHLGRHHARILGGLEGVELAAVVEPDQERGRAVAGRAGAPWLRHRDDLPGDVDFAVIAVPTVKHRECARELLRAGVACLIEKPMAPDVATCEAILADGEAGGARVGVGHVERFNPAVKRALELGISPRFIEAHRLAPYPFRSTDVGVVLDLMIHDLDLVRAWVGRPVRSVDAVGGSVMSSTEDIVSARLHFEGGAVANLTASRLSLKPMRRFRVFGPDCYVSVDSQERYALLVQKASHVTPEHLEAAARSDNPQEAFQDLMQIEELSFDDEEPLRAELVAFAEAVREDRDPPVTGEDGRANVALAHRVVESMAHSAWQGETTAH